MPTTNTVPSQDPSDLLFNAGKLDEVLNGTGNTFTDRLGVARRTVAGMNSDFDAQLADAESDLNVYRADAAASAAEALGYLQTIRATSYGAYASDPATDPLGNPPTIGDEYFNTASNLLKRWNGTTWQASDINTANLAASSGSSLVGYDGQTVQDVLDSAKPMANYTALRNYTGRATSIRITQIGLSGFFQRLAVGHPEYSVAEDGGVIIVDAAGRRWKRLYDGAVYVNWFEAKGDGVTDDTLAIQNALNTRKDVLVPEGNYRVTSTLQYYSLQTFSGLGDKSQIKSEISGNVVFLNAETVYNCNFHDFKILGTGNETGGIRVTEGFEGMRLSRVFVSTVGGKAFWFSKIYVVDCYDIWAEGNNITEFGLFLEDVTNFNFYGCHFRECKKEGAGARLNKNIAANYVINFHGCIFESNYGDGLQIQSGNAVTIDGCYFEANAREYLSDNTFRANHISIKPFGSSGFIGGQQITVKNCYFNPNYVQHLIQSTAPVEPLNIENNLEQNFGIYPHQLVRYDLDLTVSVNSRAQLIGHIPQECNVYGKTESLSATNHRFPQMDNIRLVYYNAAGNAIEGDVPATITSTRTMHGGSVKVCVFTISNINTSGIDAARLIAVIPPINRFSSGQFTAALDHVGTSGTGVLGFYLRSDQTGNVFFLRKQRLTASGSSVGRAGDLVGVTELSGSISYF